MQTFIRSVSVLLTIVLLSIGSSAFAETPPTAKATVQKIIDLCKELDNPSVSAKNQKEMESLVDFKRLAGATMTGFEDKMTPAQKEQIEDLLKKIITKTTYPEAPKFFKDAKIEFASETPEDTLVHLKSIISKGDKRTTVDYWLAPENNSFRVIDLAIEGERWVENVKDQFEEIVQKKGVPTLIDRMKKKITNLDIKNKKVKK